MSLASPLHVAVGVVQNQVGEVLVSFRDHSRHQGGLWEFPGGKVDPGESAQKALCREFQEELGITPTVCFPFKQILHQYSDKAVLLDVWRITRFSGIPAGLEGQAVKWVPAAELRFRDFPAANKDIIRLLRLPDNIPITPQAESLHDLLAILEDFASKKYPLVYCHQPHLLPAEFGQWSQAVSELCLKRGVTLISCLDDAHFDLTYPASGMHAKASELMALDSRPCSDDSYFSASCHSLEELEKAQSLGADFVFLSPVLAASAKGDSGCLGWDKFKELAGSVSLPVYAAGGVTNENLQQAQACGAFGVAGYMA